MAEKRGVLLLTQFVLHPVHPLSYDPPPPSNADIDTKQRQTTSTRHTHALDGPSLGCTLCETCRQDSDIFEFQDRSRKEDNGRQRPILDKEGRADTMAAAAAALKTAVVLLIWTGTSIEGQSRSNGEKEMRHFMLNRVPEMSTKSAWANWHEILKN